MGTAGPATRPTHSFFKFSAHSFDMLTSRFGLFNIRGPADPFIACKRSNILPLCPRLWVSDESLPQILWHFVYGTA